MPKRGVTQPWRVVFRWENDIGGANNYGSQSDAQLFVDALKHRSKQTDMRVAYKVVNRLEDRTPLTVLHMQMRRAVGVFQEAQNG